MPRILRRWSFLKTLPATLETIRAGLPKGTPIELWWQDEARVGQKNKIARRWARRGTRPRAPHDQRTSSAYIFGAICPQQGKGAALVPAVLLLGFWATVMRFGSGWEGSGGRLSPTGLGAAWRRPGCPAARSRRRTPDSWSGPAGSGRSARAAQASCEPCATRPRPDRTRCGSQTPAD